MSLEMQRWFENVLHINQVLQGEKVTPAHHLGTPFGPKPSCGARKSFKYLFGWQKIIKVARQQSWFPALGVNELLSYIGPEYYIICS